jgi:adenosylcobinamide-GDP ribazoletransferase
MRLMLKPFVTALRTLTVLPVPGKEATTPSASLPFFPVVGAVLGIVLYYEAVGTSLLFNTNSLIGGCIVTVTAILITGMLHIDGFADVADGFGGGRTGERVLEIMKDSRHGTYGVVTIVFDIIGRVVLTAWCIEHRHFELIAASPVFSRLVQAWGCALLPYARAEGGTASPFFSARPPVVLLIVSLGIAGVCPFVSGALPLGTILLVSLLPVQLFFAYCLQRIDGITGDCLGAVNEISELSLLFTGCVAFSLRF